MKNLSKRQKLIFIALVPFAVISLTIYFYILGKRYIGTDNAYVKASKVFISAEVSGKVASLEVKENDKVDEGQVLFHIDSELYSINVTEAQAKLHDTQNSIEVAKAKYLQTCENLKLAEINKYYLHRELNRALELSKKQAATKAQVDEATNKFEGAKQKIAMLEQEKKQLLLDLGGNPELPATRHPRYIAAKASLEQAELDLKRTIIKAPSSGIVSQISNLSVGDYITKGTSLFSIVMLNSMWVEANLKETDLTNIKPGQYATITIDAYPGLKLKAKVESIGAATGAEFSILPPQNATGNWVKIVQRVPVRLAVEQSNQDMPLRAGMSAIVEIDIKS